MKPPIIMGNNNTLERGWPQAVRLHIHTSEGKDRPFFLSTGTTIYSHVQLETARQAVQLGRTVSGLLSCFATVPLGRNNPAPATRCAARPVAFLLDQHDAHSDAASMSGKY
jgi:hypothetical protein